jgi:hypothetical protein
MMALLAAATLWAAEPNTLTKQEKKDGWRLLFDGKTLKGWNDPRRKAPPGDGWTVENGAIKAIAHPKIREDVISVAKFRDFELVWEWRIEKGSNSGLKYRIQDKFFLDRAKFKKGVSFEEGVGYELANKLSSRQAPSAEGGEEYVVAFEYQMIDDDAHADARRGALYQTGAIYSMIPAVKKTARPVGEWNESRVVLRGDRVEHWLNGEKVVDATLQAPEIEAAAAKRWKKHAPAVYDQLVKQPVRECSIGLQHHNDPVWFRSIRVRGLK